MVRAAACLVSDVFWVTGFGSAAVLDDVLNSLDAAAPTTGGAEIAERACSRTIAGRMCVGRAASKHAELLGRPDLHVLRAQDSHLLGPALHFQWGLC